MSRQHRDRLSRIWEVTPEHGDKLFVEFERPVSLERARQWAATQTVRPIGIEPVITVKLNIDGGPASY